MGYAPHHLALQGVPPRGSLDVRKGFPFLPKKMKFAEFFSGKGKAWNKADNFCLIVHKHDEARGSRDFGALFILCGICGGFFGGFRGAAFFFAHFFGKRRGDTHFFVRRRYAVGFDRIKLFRFGVVGTEVALCFITHKQR